MTPLNAPENGLALEATELFSGFTAQLPLPRVARDAAHHSTAAAVDQSSRAGSGPLERQSRQDSLCAGRTGVRTTCSRHHRDRGRFTRRAQHDELGSEPLWNRSHQRARSAGGGTSATTSRSPRGPLRDGVAVEGFDLRSPGGITCISQEPTAGSNGGSPCTESRSDCPTGSCRPYLNDRINNFAVPIARQLGRDCRRPRSRGMETRRLAALGAGLVEGQPPRGHSGRAQCGHPARVRRDAGDSLRGPSGRVLWALTPATSGQVRQVSPQRPTGACAVAASTDGGRVYVLRNGKVVATLPTTADELAVSPDGSRGRGGRRPT